ncbi:MAG: PD40 domain-containing protein [Candidatus Krumholzibacteriota bacterium]|nr:PD40 domain-containing protein [Candidatus Krumholzibacteriota bacterium]
MSFRLPLLAVLLLLAAAPAAAVDIRDTRLLAEPDCSADQVVFTYAGDLWVAPLAGGTARRLTADVGRERRPRFSPDGTLIAFSGEYDGNEDVFVIPAEGGEPRRLTWHPGEDVVQGFTPDGSAVLFTSQRSAHTRRIAQLFTVPIGGGFPERLPVPRAAKAEFSPDGEVVAYLPLGEVFRQWKHYRGGQASRIWLQDLSDASVLQIPQPEGRCNDTDPMWFAGRFFFLSDRDGEFNLYCFDHETGTVEQRTFHDDFPVVAAAAGPGGIVYEQAGWLHRFDPATGASGRLVIGVAADLPEARPRWAAGDEWIRHWDLSPSGARAVFEFRGEIVTVPAEKGDPRDLTRTPGAHERWPAWSPDGARIAWFSDAGGEEALHVAPQDGAGAARVYPLAGAGFYDRPLWSPDGTKIAFSDNAWALFWIDLDTGRVREVSREILYGPAKTLRYAWSPDSRWLAFTRNTATLFQELWLCDLESGEAHLVTDGLSDAVEPAFDASGRHLFFAASTDAGPVRQWFAMSNEDMQMTRNLYVVVLRAGDPSPLAPESDEEGAGEAAADEDKDDGKRGKKGRKGDNGGDADGTPPRVAVDVAGLGQRILALPLDAALYSDLQAGEAGRLYYLKRAAEGRRGNRDATSQLCRFDLDEREEKVLVEGVGAYRLAAGGKKLLVRVGSAWSVCDADSPDPAQGSLAMDAVRVRVVPREEWPQIFHEAWRINRDYFYDPGMHGADWPGVRDKYAVFLPHLTGRDDLTRVLRWLGSELAVGHHYLWGGDRRREAETVPGGLLGADYEVSEGRYRFARVYGGLNWNPDLRAPLTEPGVGVQAGEYLLAVDGEDLRPPENLFTRFEHAAGRIVALTVGPRADGKDARTVRAVPVEDEAALRHRAWVEGNLRRVEEATGGRVAYVYVPNTTTRGHEYFKRYFFPQADREAIIIDERHNGGGQVADYYIDILRRPHICWWATRYGRDFPTPLSAIQGPKAMLIDETAGSGGDLLPWMFRKQELGTLVGRRTWGGLVGILGFPVLMDGGYITAPNLAIWTEDGFIVENEGVPPDVEVEMLPAALLAGRDPQLEAAIAIVLEKLAADPPRRPARPPYPLRALGAAADER